MRPLQITAKNFGSYTDVTIPLDMLHIASIVGSNGAGKSTGVTAMLVALYGKKAGSLDNFIRKGTNGFSVTFDFECDGGRYKIVREQGRSQKVSLLRAHPEDGQYTPLADDKVAEVDEAIVTLIGADYESFTLSSFLRQGEIGKFPAMKPADRKAWLMKHLPLGNYYDLEAKAKAQRDEVDRRITFLEGKLSATTITSDEDIAVISESIERLKSEGLCLQEAEAHARYSYDEALASKAKADDAAQAYAEASTSADRAKQAFDQEATRVSTMAYKIQLETDTLGDEPPMPEDTSALHNETTSLNAELSEVSDHKREVATAQSELDAATRAYDESVTAAVAQANELARVQAEEPTDTCPHCGAKPEHQDQVRLIAAASEKSVQADRHSCEMDQEKLDAIEACNTVEKRETPDESAIRARLSVISNAVKHSQEARNAHDLWKSKGESIGQLKAAHAEAEKSLAALKDADTEARARLDATKPVMTAAIGAHYLACVDELQAAHDAAEACADELADKKRDLEYMLKTNAECESTRVDLATSTQELSIMKMLVTAYGKNGIPARLLESAIMEIEARANEFLSQFENGLAISFQTQRENKGAGVSETLDILVSDPEGTRSLDTFSGGESTRVNFALAVGIRDFVAARTSKKIDMFVVDEPEYLDAAGTAELVNCLHIIARDTSLVLLISHIDSVSGAFAQSIEVTKGSNGSVVEVRS